MVEINRREFVHATAAATLLASAASATDTPAPAAATGAFGQPHVPAPLPFDAKSLKGISEKLIQSHWLKNIKCASNKRLMLPFKKVLRHYKRKCQLWLILSRTAKGYC